MFAAKVATEFRQKFQHPVVIDMFCYRRYGHNEGDEPAFTQPLMYKAIRTHPTTLEIYAKKLDRRRTSSPRAKSRRCGPTGAPGSMPSSRRAQGYKPNSADWLDGRWADIKAARDVDDPRRGHTGVAARDAQGDRREDHGGPARLPRPPHHPALPRQPPQGDRDRRGHRLGDRPRRWRSARCCSRAIRCGCPARTPSAAPSRSAIRCWSTRRTRTATSRSIISARARRASRSSTRCCRKRRCSASSTAIRSPSRMR